MSPDELTGATRRAQSAILGALDELRDLLETKCNQYGGSALIPQVTIWPELTPEMALKARFTDKLARLATMAAGDKEDALLDAVGYGVLLLALRHLGAEEA